MTGTIHFPILSQIEIGEPDANSEFFSSQRENSIPIFLSNFHVTENFPIADFSKGKKYIVYGHKGTGKTAALRYIENKIKDRYDTNFIIFKRSVMEEVDISHFSKIPLMVDDKHINSIKHFHHAIKRMLIIILLGMIKDVEAGVEKKEGIITSVISKLKESRVFDLISYSFETVRDAFESTSIDISKISNSKAFVDAAMMLKKQNDELLSFLIKSSIKHGSHLAIFLDEIHFAYRSEDALQQDAMLVRDTILAVQSLNERFIQEGLNINIYCGIRSEYLEHPIISTADVNHAVESVGFNLNWSFFANDKSHPLFELIYKRFKSSIGDSFTIGEFFRIYLNSIDPETFLNRTWAKPRDFVRFFKISKEMYPNKSQLGTSEQNAVWRTYSHAAWSELKTSASPFLPPESLSLFESVMKRVTAETLDGKKKYSVSDFELILKPVYDSAKKKSKNFYSKDHFMNLIFMLGVFGTRHTDKNHQDIYQTFHRGNRSFHDLGEVRIHPTILKALG